MDKEDKAPAPDETIPDLLRQIRDELRYHGDLMLMKSGLQPRYDFGSRVCADRRGSAQ